MFYCETCWKEVYPWEDIAWEEANSNTTFYPSRVCENCKLPAICVDDSFLDEVDEEEGFQDCDCSSCRRARGEY